MKTLTYIIVVLAGLSLTSCIIVTDTPGPAGRPGNAYFGVSYDVYEPYSYWDNNPDIPNDPYLDEYYPTVPGLYEFEYYVNRVDYWYGTYEIWVNAGEPGRPGGRPGRDGLDTYLMLVLMKPENRPEPGIRLPPLPFPTVRYNTLLPMPTVE